MESLNTIRMQELVSRYQSGDKQALDTLIRQTGDRLERLARQMLRDFPRVRDHEQTGDVLQNAIIRLSRTLIQVKPSSVRHFFSLAAMQLRYELLDLARFYARRPKMAAMETVDVALGHDPFIEFAGWTELHEAVEKLPTDLHEVFCLTYYHGWKQMQVAELLGISDRQVRRLWVDACSRIQQITNNQLPRM